MGSTMYSEERRIASLAVQHASLLTKSVMRSITHVSKKDSTPVTVADFAVQALLISTLSQAFPADNFLGEESAAALREDAVLCAQVWELVSSSRKSLAQEGKGRATTALVPPSSPEQMLELIDRGGLGAGGRQGRTWIMDPIDGTATFIQGGQYAVALALIEDGREVLGVVGCPNLALDLPRLETVPVDADGYGFIASAVRGDGGVLVQPIRPSGELPPGQFIPSRRPSSQPPTAAAADLNFVDSILGDEHQLRRARKLASSLGCACLPTTEIWSTQVRLVVMALAGGDAMVQVRLPRPYDGGEEDPENCIWDYAGAHLILLESGGGASDLDGKEIDFGAGRRLAGNWGLIAASRPELQARLLSQAKEFCAGEAVQSGDGEKSE